MNRRRLRNLARKRLGENVAAFWTDDELNDYINDAGHDVVEKAKCIKANGYITTVADTAEYTISSNFSNYLAVTEVYMYQDATTWRRLDQTNRDRLKREQPGWKSADNGVPNEYYWDKEEDVLGVFPKPNSTNAGTNYLQVYYADGYTDITSDDDEPAGVSHMLQLAMVDYVVALGYETRGWGDKANDAFKKYYFKIKEYLVDRDTEKQEDDEGIVMKNYRNI